MQIYSSPDCPDVVTASDRGAIHHFMPYILAKVRTGRRHNVAFLGGVLAYAAKDGSFLVWEMNFKAGTRVLDLSFVMFRRPATSSRGGRQMPPVTLGDVLD